MRFSRIPVWLSYSAIIHTEWGRQGETSLNVPTIFIDAAAGVWYHRGSGWASLGTEQEAYATDDVLAETLKTVGPDLLEISHRVHGLRELRFEETLSSRALQELLTRYGFSVESGLAGMDTSFIARRGHGESIVGFFAEYDALPEIGHACGHNIIAASSTGAGILLAKWLEAKKLDGEVWVVGSPGEEGGGGKIRLLDSGVLDSLSVAMMFHPSAEDEVAPQYLFREGIDVKFYGKEAHFAAAPEQGVNALSALLLWFHFIDALRYHLDPRTKVHGIITDGGASPSVVPAFASARMLVRAPDAALARTTLEKVIRGAESAAAGTGCQMEWERFVPPYEDVIHEPQLVSYIEKALAERGRTPIRDRPPLGSTDMGNVSHRIPSIHANIGIGLGLAPHTRSFEHAARSPEADRAVLDAAYALARAASLYLGAPTTQRGYGFDG